MKKEKRLYEEGYKKWGMELRQDCLPILPAAKGKFKCVDAYLVKCGKVERDGKELEYQEVRIYLEPDDSGEESQFEKDIRQNQKEKCSKRAVEFLNDPHYSERLTKVIMEAD